MSDSRPPGPHHRRQAYTRLALAAIGVIIGANSAHAQTFTTYRYDALGRRIEKVVDDGAVQTTRFYYSGWQVVEEQDGVDVTDATYALGRDLDEVVHMDRRGDEVYYHGDANTNVVALTDAAAEPIERYIYSDFGRAAVLGPVGQPQTASAAGNSYRFTGRRLDDETNWYWYRSRYHDPAGGRYVQRDGIGTWGDPLSAGNGLVYAVNNPWSHTDPAGHRITVEGTPHYQKKLRQHLKELQTKGGPEVKRVLEDLFKSDKEHVIKAPDDYDKNGNSTDFPEGKEADASNGKGTGTTVHYDPDRYRTPSGRHRAPQIGLIHELSHAWDADRGITAPLNDTTQYGLHRAEERACRLENRVREKRGNSLRNKYGNKRLENPTGPYKFGR